MVASCPVTGATYTDSQGRPHDSPVAYQTAGKDGPLLLQDFHLLDALAHHNRERIPERVVHAKGAGAHGIWETTDDVSDICCADFLQKGKTSPVTMRFSTVGGESGSSDTARDPRGFSLKVKTQEGNWDLVANNTPVFFLRNPHKFLHLIHTQKRNPQTHLKDPDAFWSFFAENPESAHQVLILFSDRGITSFAHQNGYSGHTFKWVNAKGEWHYVQIHLKADKGVKTFTHEEGAAMDASNPDSGTKELFDDIEKGDFPSWTAYIQTMTLEQAKEFRYSVFDLTKIWPHKEYPLRKIGKVTLNKNPENYFTEVEQAAFAPSHLVNGMEPSADPVLQARLFSYPDAHRYRLGVNYAYLPVNQAVCPINNFHRDGSMAGISSNGGSASNYPDPSAKLAYKKAPYTLQQTSEPKDSAEPMMFVDEVTDLDFEQPRALWEKVFDDAQKERYVQNVAGHLGNAKPEVIRAALDNIFTRVDKDLSDRIEKAIGDKGQKNAISVTSDDYKRPN